MIRENRKGIRAMRRLTTFTVTFSAILLFSTAFTHAAAGPIPISSIEELQRIGNEEGYPLNGNYVLTQDIDASHTAYWHNGQGFAPIGQRLDEDDSLAFNGWFDGQGHVIRGLVINRPDVQGVGLFGSISSSAIVVNINLEGGTITGSHYVGALVGENWSQDVAACSSSADVNGLTRIGGMAGINRGILDSCNAAGTVQGNEYVGGLVGRNYKGIVQSCYSTGEVYGIHWAGGLIGGSFEGETYDSFWDIELSGMTVSAGGVGMTSEEIARL